MAIVHEKILTMQKYKPSKDEYKTEQKVIEKLSEELGLEKPEFKWLADLSAQGQHYEDLSNGKPTKIHIRQNNKDICNVTVKTENGLFISYKMKGQEYFVSTMKERVRNSSKKPLQKGIWVQAALINYGKTEEKKEPEKMEKWEKNLLYGTDRSKVRRKQIDYMYQQREEEERRAKEARDRECQLALENEIWHRTMEDYGENLTYLYHD